MREKDWKGCIFIEKPRPKITKKQGVFVYNGRIACEINDKFICLTFNSKDNKLFFEITKKPN